jgi:enoyl-CoA hydratase/carnithine racemase
LEQLEYEKNQVGKYAVFTLNRPEKLNAISSRLMFDLKNCLDDFDSDPNMRVGIITGYGRAFSAGADLREGIEKEKKVEELTKLVDTGQLSQDELSKKIDREYPNIQVQYDLFSKRDKPFIAAVNGFAIGGGMAASYGSQYLPYLIPFGESLYYLLTSDKIPADEAKKIGLIHDVVAQDDLLARAIQITELIIQGAPNAISATKKLAYYFKNNMELQRMEYVQPILDSIQESPNSLEGRKAFSEKRLPKWVD